VMMKFAEVMQSRQGNKDDTAENPTEVVTGFPHKYRDVFAMLDKFVDNFNFTEWIWTFFQSRKTNTCSTACPNMSEVNDVLIFVLHLPHFPQYVLSIK